MKFLVEVFMRVDGGPWHGGQFDATAADVLALAAFIGGCANEKKDFDRTAVIGEFRAHVSGKASEG